MKILDIRKVGYSVKFFLGLPSIQYWTGPYWEYEPKLNVDIAKTVDQKFVEKIIYVYFNFNLKINEPRIDGETIFSKQSVYRQEIPLLVFNDQGNQLDIFMGDDFEKIPAWFILQQYEDEPK